MGKLAWKLSRAKRGRTQRKEKKFSPLPPLAHARERQYSRALVYFVRPTIPELVFRFQFTWYHNEAFVPEREFQSKWKPEWLTCAGTKFRFNIMWTDAKKCMEMEWTRSGMKFIPVSCKQLQRNVTIWCSNPIIPTIFISRVEKREKASSGKFLIADPVAATVTERVVMHLLKSYPL